MWCFGDFFDRFPLFFPGDDAVEEVLHVVGVKKSGVFEEFGSEGIPGIFFESGFKFFAQASVGFVEVVFCLLRH